MIETTRLEPCGSTEELYKRIDARSFRTFHFQGDYLLFDRSTGATLQVDELSHSVLRKIQNNEVSDVAIGDLTEEFGTQAIEAVFEALRSLLGRGFFRYSAVDQDEQEHLIERLWRHKPRRIQLLMAQGCNLGCRYCYAWRNGSNQKSTLMPFEVAKASVDHLVRCSGERTELQVTFFGGEPLLNYEVMREVVDYCRGLEKVSAKRFLFELITNGTLLTHEITDWIVSERFLLFVSLDGWKEMHNYNRPSMAGDDLYETIVENAVYANREYERANLPPMKVRANLTNRFHDSFKVGNYLATLGFKVIGVGAIEPLPHGDQSPIALSEDQMDELFDTHTEQLVSAVEAVIDSRRLSRFMSIQLNKSLKQLEPRSLKGVTCGVARNTQVVDNKGNIFPCHRYEGMEAYIIGNVFTGLDREKTMAYYRKVNGNATNRCHSCWIRDYCAGGCAWLLSAKDGHLADPTLRECDRRRRGVERALWLRQRMRSGVPSRFSGNEIALETWEWGPGFAPDNDSQASGELSPEVSSSCGSDCGNCGPTGCSD